MELFPRGGPSPTPGSIFINEGEDLLELFQFFAFRGGFRSSRVWNGIVKELQKQRQTVCNEAMVRDQQGESPRCRM
jgi:hypothetical protein